MIAPSRYWIIQKDGITVAKFDTAGETIVAPEIEHHDPFNVVGLDTREDLEAEGVDYSALTDKEREMLGGPQ